MTKLLRYYGNDLEDIDFDPWLEEKPEVLHPIIVKWFSLVKNCGPDVQDIFHDGYPIVCVDDAPFAYVNAFTAHVNLGFFYGAELPDPMNLMEGTGKRMRHIKLRPGAQNDEEAIRLLIELAYADIKERLISEGA